MQMNNYKVFWCGDLSCFYRLGENELEYCNAEDILVDAWAEVEENLVGEEEVVFNGRKRTLSEVYRIVEKELGDK